MVAMKRGKLVAQGSVDEIMQSEVLLNIYDMEIPIQEINQQKIAVYFK